MTSDRREALLRLWRTSLRLVPLLIVLYAGMLRFDALVAEYGLVRGPEWLERVERAVLQTAHCLRPGILNWPFVGVHHGDPASYLKIARAAKSFHEASLREPLFVWSIKFFLWLTSDQDVAVNLASGFYSTLLVLATYLLGTIAFSPLVGIGAASALAVDGGAIYLGADGWRDDAFAFFVVMTAYGLLLLRSSFSPRSALLAGTFAAGAILTRVTGLTFILAGFGYVMLDGPRVELRKRASMAALALAVAAAIAAPFYVNCALKFGTPLASIDAHTGFYRSRSGASGKERMSALAYIGERFTKRPLATTDGMLHGLTIHPFEDKWQLQTVAEVLPAILQWGAVFGLIGFVASAEGRLLLIVMLAGLVPFAFTWNIPGGGYARFTLFAYPFQLIASFFVLTSPRFVLDGGWHRLRECCTRRRVAWSLTAVVVLATVAPFVPRCWQYLLVREQWVVEGAYTIASGDTDRWFFGTGWYPPTTAGAVTGRYSRGTAAVLFIPAFAQQALRLTFRMQACSADSEPVRDVRVSINHTEVGELRVVWDDHKAGAYDVAVPGSLVREGWNRVDLQTTGPTLLPSGENRYRGLQGRVSAFFLWYVRVTPAPQAGWARSHCNHSQLLN